MRSFLDNVLPYYRAYRGRVIWGLFFTLVGTVFSVAGPWFIRLAINGLQTSISHDKLWLYGGMVLAVAGISGMSRFFLREKPSQEIFLVLFTRVMRLCCFRWRCFGAGGWE